MDQRCRLLRQGARQRRVAVPERCDANAGNQVEIAVAALREQRTALPRLEYHGSAAIHLQHMLRVERDWIRRCLRQHKTVPGACAYSPARPSMMRTSDTPAAIASRHAPSLATMPSRAAPRATICRTVRSSRRSQVLPDSSNTPGVLPPMIRRVAPMAEARCAASTSALTFSRSPAALTPMLAT